MAKKKPWELLGKINESHANRLARELNDASRSLAHAQRQRSGLAQARQVYVVQPEKDVPISLVRNQRAFLSKLDSALIDLDKSIGKLAEERDALMAAWRAAKGKVEGFEQLAELDHLQWQRAMAAQDQQRIEEISGVAKHLADADLPRNGEAD